MWTFLLQVDMSVVAMVTDKLMLPGLKEYNIYVIYISLFIATTFVNKVRC